MFILSFFIISPIIALILLFWYKTNFVWEYGKLFGLRKFLKIDLFEEKLKINFELTYYQFIATTYNNFFVKLIICSVCLSTWLSIIFCFLTFLFLNDYVILFMIPFNALLGLFYYLTIKRCL